MGYGYLHRKVCFSVFLIFLVGGGAIKKGASFEHYTCIGFVFVMSEFGGYGGYFYQDTTWKWFY